MKNMIRNLVTLALLFVGGVTTDSHAGQPTAQSPMRHGPGGMRPRSLPLPPLLYADWTDLQKVTTPTTIYVLSYPSGQWRLESVAEIVAGPTGKNVIRLSGQSDTDQSEQAIESVRELRQQEFPIGSGRYELRSAQLRVYGPRPKPAR